MSEDVQKDAASVRFPPPFVPLILLVVAELVHRFVSPLPLPLSVGVRVLLAAALIAASGALIAGAFGLFRRTGQDPAPWESSPELIAEGIYRFTRNPMYLGMGLLQAGLGVALLDGWAVALVPLSWLVIYLIAIRHEEAYLERKFGESYLTYKRSVRRWL